MPLINVIEVRVNMLYIYVMLSENGVAIDCHHDMYSDGGNGVLIGELFL